MFAVHNLRMLFLLVSVLCCMATGEPIHRYGGRHGGGFGLQQQQHRNHTLNEKHIPWKSLEMPTKSWFVGMPAPNDTGLWAEAIAHARKGSQLLLQKAREKIRSPGDLIPGDIHFRWLHMQADVFLSSTTLKPERSRGFKALEAEYFGDRAPIAMLGYYEFSGKFQEAIRHMDFGPDSLAAIANFSNPTRITARKYVGIGCPNENWGWLSTYYLNRTINWKHSFKGSDILKGRVDQTEELRAFLDDPNLIMLLVNQHHNITHEKVISVPLGVTDPKSVWWSMNQVLLKKKVKGELLNSITSSWGVRPEIKRCVFRAMGVEEKRARNVPKNVFYEEMAASMAVLCLPGLGYDSYRLSEALAMGTMPIMERGVGFDRTMYRLPALLVDDFSELSLHTIQQAYVEALYWALADAWEYQRVTPQWWTGLIHEASAAGNAKVLEQQHPYSAVDTGFTRPLIPFDCAKMGGCGPGTKRVPKKSCAIDFDTNWVEYTKANMWTWAK